MEDSDGKQPESLLPYDDWTEAALRRVMVRALAHVAEHGLPGGHHFYVTFRTDHPNTVIPKRMRAQFPTEMTIVLQHQFWDLAVDEAADEFRVGLSFGGVPTTIHVPLGAVIAFADPEVRFGLQFRPVMPEESAGPEEPAAALQALKSDEPAPPAEEEPQVVSLDAFRRRTPPKE